MNPRPASGVLSPGLSVYLDGVRFFAALVVLLSHFAYTRFTGGDYLIIRELNLGSDAVVLFFVLSGFVIAFAAREKDGTARRFAFSRLSRLWSVAVPALLLTLICDSAGLLRAPEFYLDTPFYNAVGGLEFWARGLSFSNHWFGENIRLGSNGPFWSLSYEAAYYLIFAVLLYLRGVARLAALALCALAFGMNIWLLAPAWFMGVGVYALAKRLTVLEVSPVTLGALIIVPLIIYPILLAMGVAPWLRGATYALFGPDRFASLGFADEFVWNALIGGLFALHLTGMSIWLKSQAFVPGPVSRHIKWLAGASFSLYLVHYPVLQMLGATLPETGVPVLDHALLLGLTLVACFVFAAAFERPLPLFRRMWREAMQARRQAAT